MEPGPVIVVVPADRRAALRARRVVAATLESWGLQRLCADAELVVSELISNAVMHAPGAAGHELQVIRRAAGIRLGVVDHSSAAPAIRPKGDGRPGGRGLRIVAALAARWGYEIRLGGKLVWADLDDVGSSAALSASSGRGSRQR